MRDYGKVHTKFWSSATIKALPDSGRLFALYLMTSPHTTITGTFRLPDGYACDDTGWRPATVREGFASLEREGFATRCPVTSWVWIVNHLEWNRPENPNQWKAAAKLAGTIPDNCSWKSQFLRMWGAPLGLTVPGAAGTVGEGFPQPVGTLSKSGAGAGAGAETGAGTGNTAPSGADVVGDPPDDQQPPLELGAQLSMSKVPDCPHEQILAEYHRILPMCPEVREWTAKRRQHLQARWKGRRERQSLDWWTGLFQYIADCCPFLIGRKPGRGGRPPFLASLPWLVESDDRLVEVMEGKFFEGVAP